MPQVACPEQDTLQAFARGALAGERWTAVLRHVEDCGRCLEQLEHLDDAADDLVAELQSLRSATPTGHVDLSHAAPEVGIHRQFSIDAGRSLAEKLKHGPVHLDRFELKGELGVGSFGYVFQAWDPRLERFVALKVQRAGDLTPRDEVERFLREARSAAQLKHPSIVSLYETHQTNDGVWFLVCEYIDGDTLESRLAHDQLAETAAIALAIEIADALQYAHEHGVVHRDVKPSNIIIDRSDRAHLMDFGLAKRESGDPGVTTEGRVLGTPAYMSPEQAGGNSSQVDARSDVYSLGGVLYEMLGGQRPFQGNRRALLLQVLEDEPRSLRQLRPAIHRDLEVICRTAMAKLPCERYQTAKELADDLRRYQQGLPTRARPPQPVERTWRWCRRNPLAVVVLLSVLVSSVAGLWHLSSLSEHFVRQTALESARLEAKMLDEVWRFYSEEISDIDPLASNISITENYRTIHPSMPLPATFAIDLGERISRRNPGTQVRVYSRYPWPGRERGGPQDEFEQIALTWLEAPTATPADRPREYTQFVTQDGNRQLHYYSARLMEESCLGCHNHPDSRSPKKDWRVGDVVGVLKIVRPLDREIENTQSGLRGAFALMGAVATGMLTGYGAIAMLAQRRRRNARQ